MHEYQQELHHLRLIRLEAIGDSELEKLNLSSGKYL